MSTLTIGSKANIFSFFNNYIKKINRKENKEVEIYCVKCRAKRTPAETSSIITKNGKPAVQGVCPECGTKILRFVKSN